MERQEHEPVTSMKSGARGEGAPVGSGDRADLGHPIGPLGTFYERLG